MSLLDAICLCEVPGWHQSAIEMVSVQLAWVTAMRQGVHKKSKEDMTCTL
jgi:hypothetical protein